MNINNKSGKSILCVFLIICTLDLVLAGCKPDNGVVDMNNSSTPAEVETSESNTNLIGNTNGNLSNQGIAAMSGDWIYFASPAHPFSSDKGELYKIKKNENEKIKLCDDMPFYINVAGNWVYYINGSDEGYIYKINTDGTGRIKVGDDKSFRISVIDDWIYYVNASDRFLYKIKTDGTGRTSLTNHKVGEINVSGEWIYYFDVPTGIMGEAHSIYKIKNDGTENTKIQDKAGSHFEVVGDWVYFFYVFGKDKSIYKIKTDGTGYSKVSDVTLVTMNVVGDWIYYGSVTEGLSRMKKDGSENTLLLSNPKVTNIINAVGDWIYFSSDVLTEYGYEPYLFKMKIDGSLVQQVN